MASHKQHVCMHRPGLEAQDRQEKVLKVETVKAGDGESSPCVGHRQRQLSCENGLFLLTAQWQVWQRGCGGLQESSKWRLLNLLQQLILTNEVLIQMKLRYAWRSCLLKLLSTSWRVKAASAPAGRAVISKLGLAVKPKSGQVLDVKVLQCSNRSSAGSHYISYPWDWDGKAALGTVEYLLWKPLLDQAWLHWPSWTFRKFIFRGKTIYVCEIQTASCCFKTGKTSWLLRYQECQQYSRAAGVRDFSSCLG